MIFYPHKIKGKFKQGKHCSGMDKCRIDGSGDIIVGNYVIFSRDCLIYTHDHYKSKSSTIYEQTMRKGVVISNLVIEDDVYLGTRCIVLNSVSRIAKGVVIAAGAILTKDADQEYGIYAGVPAIKIGERE